MKLRFVLAISIALNLCFGWIVFRRAANPSNIPDHVSAAVRPATNARSQVITATTNETPTQFNWQSVEADDYRVYIANLRAIGCPEETIQDIIIADVFKLFEEKKRRARAGVPKIEYWKTSSRFLVDLESYAWNLDRRLSQPIEAERNALLRTFGIEPTLQNMPVSSLDWRELLLDFLSAEKRQQITKLNARLREEREALRATLGPDELQQAFTKHYHDSDRRIKELLTPEEALQYDLRVSTTANSMRASLGGFDPTEAEFIQIFKFRKSYDDFINGEINDHGGIPVDQVNTAKNALDQQIRSVLGESRFQDYDRTGDSGFQQLWKVAEKAGQPTSVAIASFEIRRAAIEKAYELRQGNIDESARKRALSAIRDETEAAMQATVGAQTWEQYKQDPFIIEWLERISPRQQ